ncbi:MAG: hypothetical protein KJO05_08780 [Bacteroidia bacterium]|nr:hypothetical protein [Bacteroidia bacterium]NNK53166.1 hypothetical protein [Flavobacteriaceae bacterium]NNM09380.1 hypothetical protein [Flavobacteriaceae bacterium]
MRNVLTLTLALGLSVCFAQNKQLLYGFDEVPQSLMLNPGTKVPQKKHFGIPFLSQLHINGGSSGVSVFDIFGESNVDINTRIRNKIFELKNSDFFTATEQLEIINFGWRANNEIYFSGGIYQELDFISYFPRDLAILAWEGNRDYLDYPFNLGEISATADLLTVYHFGANKQLTKKLTAGLRVKLYSSMLSARSVDNQGTFVTTLGGPDSPNIYEHTVTNANVTLNTSGIASLDGMDSSEIPGEIIGRAFFGGNFGLGVDLGATYDINNRLSASASLIDVGMIFHGKDAETYEATGTYTLDGIELIFPPLSAGQPTLPYYDNLEDELEEEIPIDTITSGYTQFRPLKVNAALKYSFGKTVGKGAECDCRNMGGGIDRAQAVGAQFYSIFRPKGPQMAGTLFYYRRLWDFLAAKATYTVDSYSYSNVGLGMVTDLGKFNFYIAADNLLHYGNLAKAKSVSLQLGFNIKIDEE